jgi:hypothetical protein
MQANKKQKVEPKKYVVSTVCCDDEFKPCDICPVLEMFKCVSLDDVDETINKYLISILENYGDIEDVDKLTSKEDWANEIKDSFSCAAPKILDFVDMQKTIELKKVVLKWDIWEELLENINEVYDYMPYRIIIKVLEV